MSNSPIDIQLGRSEPDQLQDLCGSRIEVTQPPTYTNVCAQPDQLLRLIVVTEAEESGL